jgi:anthranilate synthase/aminodeoxychorismate synthase-like glutamine amidotransferase
MILVLDNYDSFTYNIVQLVGAFTRDILVYRNDRITVQEVELLHPDGIIISPGPGRPEHAGITIDLIQALGVSIPTLGVCLGHQAIGAAFGAAITYAPELVHGKTSLVHHSGTGIFAGVPNPLVAGRYHSLVVSKESFPESLEVLAETEDGLIMAMRHKTYPITGVQFHPESILTPDGNILISNWLKGLV